MSHLKFLGNVQSRVQILLDKYLPSANIPPVGLHKAMRYSALNPGKRLRPALVYACGQMLGAEQSILDTPAVVIELIHAYSLIHDDLPCMDDDELRRGIPTCHIAFDEATAVLAGDALQTLAFEILSTDKALNVNADSRVEMLALLSRASGSMGMGGGQAIDLEMTNKQTDLKTLESMHKMKTGALINASVKLGYLASPVRDEWVLSNLQVYSESLGLAFQIRDDILDIEADTEILGKPQGSDVAKNKSTFPALLGLEGAKLKANELVDKALEALQQLPYESDKLAIFARYIVDRKY